MRHLYKHQALKTAGWFA
uniref:Uncharacterized protein n=1 Tax=Arundo donax TaxID=35708 RepID=A0A0A9BHA3_ARUDO